MSLRIGSLFSGFGGLDMATEEVFGATTAWVSDIDKGACKILAHRYPGIPNLGDITAIDWAGVEPIDILTGGFPCQDVSIGGLRAGMHSDTRSGLWLHMAYAIDQLKPRLVVVENVRGLLNAKTRESRETVTTGPMGGQKVGHTNRALGRVLSDLADIGYDAQWLGLRATDVGACHRRFRIFLIAQPRDDGLSLRHHSVNTSVRKEAVRLLPTPTRRDYKDNVVRREPHRPKATDTLSRALVDFDSYTDATEYWKRVIERDIPTPVESTGKGDGRFRLSVHFVEWMMGLPEGWVTDVPGLSHNEALQALGNGVVPQQARTALSAMMLRNERMRVLP